MHLPTIIVTGGAGFIGSAVCRYLVRQQLARVVNIDALTYAGNLSSLKDIDGSELYHFEHANICDATKMAAIFQQHQPDGVIHLAAESHVDRSITEAQDFIQTNIVGTSVLLDVSLQHWKSLPQEKAATFKFLMASTDEVYGSLGPDGAFTEETTYNPSSPYSASKAASDHLVNAWHRTYGLPVVTSHCSNNYGPYHFPEKLIPLTILSCLKHTEIPIYGKGDNIRDWLHVEDHAKALFLIWEKGRCGERYNIGGRNERKNIDVVKRICNIMDKVSPTPLTGGHQPLITHVRDRLGHDRRYAINAQKLENELGWKAEETFDTGIKKTIQWYLDNQHWWQPILDKSYSLTRLG